MIDFKNMIYWEIDINKKNNFRTFFNGMITKEQYERIKTIDFKDSLLNDIKFFENVNDEIYNKYNNSRHSVELEDLVQDYNIF